MVTSRTRVSGAVRGSGGPESEALMSYLAMAKDQCKPPVYSAFISLINAYHGNMLAADALLDELSVLFYPRTFLLAGIKPLVDKSYHPRIDELCGKNRNGSSCGGGRSGGTSTQASLNCSSNGRNNSEIVDTSTMNARAATPKLELGEGGGLRNYRVTGGSESGSIRSSSPAGNTGGTESVRSIRGDVKLGGSPGLNSKPVSEASSSSPQKALGCSIGGIRRESEQQLGEKTKIGLPNAGALESDGADIGELLSDIEPTVDPALLDFMMRDNSPVVDSSTAQVDPPSLTLQHTQQQQQYHHQQHQHQQQQQHWSSTTLDQALLGCTSPMKRGTGESPVDPSSTAGRTPPSWGRSESATNLPEQACRIHATPNVGCRACRGGGDLGAVTTAASVGPATGHRQCSVAISSSSSSRGSPTVPRRSSLPVGRQGSLAGPGASSPSGSEGPNLEEEGFLGPGKRVWDERGGGSGGGGGGTTMATPSCPSAPQDSFFFPAAAAAAGKGNSNWTVSSRPHVKRRISTDPGANGIEERSEHRNDQSNGALCSRSGNGSNGGGERIANGMGSTGTGGLSSDPMSSEFAGIGSTPSATLTKEQHPPSSTGGAEGGLSFSKSGSDLEKLVMNVATKGMQQALQYGLRHTFSVILHKKDREIAELKEEALRWAANDTRLRQLNQQLLNDNMQLRAAAGWETRSSSSPS